MLAIYIIMPVFLSYDGYCQHYSVGAVAWDRERDIVPRHMPLSQALRGSVKFTFPGLEKNTYKGLPGLLADALPDNFGNRIIDKWLSPAYDVIYSYNPSGKWTSRHQMSVNGKQDEFTSSDLLKVAVEMNIKSAANIIERMKQAVSEWAQIAADSGVAKEQISRIQKVHRHL